MAELQTLLTDLYPMSYPGWGDTFLEADGAFGPLTDGWVRALQRQAQIKVDGIVGTNTWTAIQTLHEQTSKHRADNKAAKPDNAKPKIAPQKIVYLYSHDTSQRGLVFSRHTDRDRNGEVIQCHAPQGEAFDRVMQRVVRAVGDDAMEMLIICSHGWQKYIAIGAGYKSGDWSHFAPLKPLFERARPKMGMEIQSCIFAAANSPNKLSTGFTKWALEEWYAFESGLANITNGRLGDHKEWHSENIPERYEKAIEEIGAGTREMVEIAKTVGCLVKAGFDWQFRDREGRFEGIWACARPSGKVTVHKPHIPPGAIQS